ncbi:hypothetical protein B0H13DRAFT_1853285 [Mycena leptocephala]|nr:hypothetical protein B0H13DRAFT_1853285 [Mycena leptocephala]
MPEVGSAGYRGQSRGSERRGDVERMPILRKLRVSSGSGDVTRKVMAWRHSVGFPLTYVAVDTGGQTAHSPRQVGAAVTRRWTRRSKIGDRRLHALWALATAYEYSSLQVMKHIDHPQRNGI